MIGKILCILLCTILVCLLVALLIPAYLRVNYEQGVLQVHVKYAWFTTCVFPRQPKDTSQDTPETETPPVQKKTASSKEKQPINWDQIQYSLDTLPQIILKALKRTGQRIRLEPLKIHVLIATTDPSDTAILYGRIQAALAAALPALHRVVRICEQDIQLFPDFCEEQMDYIVDSGIMIRPWDVLVVGICALGGLLKWFIGFRKLAEKQPKKKKNTTAQAGTAA